MNGILSCYCRKNIEINTKLKKKTMLQCTEKTQSEMYEKIGTLSKIYNRAKLSLSNKLINLY